MISKECKEYEKYARRIRSKEPFPIEIKDLVSYIRYRGRSGTFFKFLTHLDVHPLHGSKWLERINNNPTIRKEVRKAIKIWNFDLREYRIPLIGVDYSIDASYYDATDSEDEHDVKKKYNKKKKSKQVNSIQKPSVPPPPQFPNVYSVAGPKTKVGFVFASKPMNKELITKLDKTPTVKVNTSSIAKKDDINLAQVVPSTPTPTYTPPSTSPSIYTPSTYTPTSPIVEPIIKSDTPPPAATVYTDIKHPIVLIRKLKPEKKRKLSITETTNKVRKEEDHNNDMEWVDVIEPIPFGYSDEFKYDEFNDQVYHAYLDRLDRIAKKNMENGKRIVEPELMVLSHVAIERYD